MWLLAAIALGVASRVEEVTDGLFLAISTDTTWCAAAFAVGRPWRAVMFLLIANAAYYAYAAPLPVQPKWFLLSMAAGLVFGRRHWTAAVGLVIVVVAELTGVPVRP